MSKKASGATYKNYGTRRTDEEIEAELIAKFGDHPLTEEEQAIWNRHVVDMKIEQAALERPADFRVGAFGNLPRSTLH